MAVNALSFFNVGTREPYDKQLDWIIEVRRDYNPLLALLNPSATSINQKAEYWKEKRLLPTMYLNTTLSGSTSTSLAFSTGTSATGSGEPIYGFAVGDVLLVDSEKVRISSITDTTAVTNRSGTTNGYTTVTVTRGYASSSQAGHTAFAAAVKFLWNDASPSATFTGAVNDPGIERIEYVKFSQVEAHVDKYGRVISSIPGGTQEGQADYIRPMELTYKMEQGILNSVNTAATESNPHYGGFTGLESYCTALTAGTHYTAAAITADEIQGCINTAEDAGCNVDLIVMAKGGWLQKGLNSFYKDEILKTNEDGRNIGPVKSWLPTLTLNGKPIKLIYHPNLLGAGYAYFLDTSKLQLKYLIRAEREVMGADGSGLRVQWYSSYMLVAKGRGTARKTVDLTGHA